jgi:hypothetical protein
MTMGERSTLASKWLEEAGNTAAAPSSSSRPALEAAAVFPDADSPLSSDDEAEPAPQLLETWIMMQVCVCVCVFEHSCGAGWAVPGGQCQLCNTLVPCTPAHTLLCSQFCEKGSLERAVKQGKFKRRSDGQPEMVRLRGWLVETLWRASSRVRRCSEPAFASDATWYE